MVVTFYGWLRKKLKTEINLEVLGREDLEWDYLRLNDTDSQLEERFGCYLSQDEECVSFERYYLDCFFLVTIFQLYEKGEGWCSWVLSKDINLVMLLCYAVVKGGE